MTRNSTKSTRRREPIELINPGTSGVIYDEAGHGVGGGARVTLAGDPDQVAMRQLAAGHLLAQRGTQWLKVVDGQLVDPNPAGIDELPDPAPVDRFSPPATEAAPAR